MKLVVMIPAYNEEKTIRNVVRSIPRKLRGVKSVKVLVINDGSSDRTGQEAIKGGADHIETHSRNMGLGVAFRTGVSIALGMGADVILNMDADGQFNSNDIPKIIEPIMGNKADMVTCTRFGKKEYEPMMPSVKKFGNRLFTKLINSLSGLKLTDTQCGFRAYSKEAALRMTLFGRFTYTQESILDLAQKGFRITEVPCIVKGQREGKSKIVSHWYSYGLKALLIIVRAIRDYHPLKFFGGIGLALFLAGGITAAALAVRFFMKQVITPYMWVIYTDVILVVVGFLMMVFALMADQTDRQRKIREEILYFEKLRKLEKK